MRPTCPNKKCTKTLHVIKDGFYKRPKSVKKIQRYRCKSCRLRFSKSTFQLNYWYKKRHFTNKLFRLLSEGVSQRAAARYLGVNRKTVDRRVDRLGNFADYEMKQYRRQRKQIKYLLFDELESFEHTKCKPLTVFIAVEDRTRKILAVEVGDIAAKGLLAKKSVKKYGKRKCERKKILESGLEKLKPCLSHDCVIKTDKSKHYPALVKKLYPEALHITYKGRRGCVVGQGELKEGGYDPMFFLNHSYASFRDHLKRLSRKTWCTTKLKHKLQHLMQMYACYHNQYLDKVRFPKLSAAITPNLGAS